MSNQDRPIAAEIRRWIFQGHYDNDIDSITTAARDRRESVKLNAVAHLRPGDHARAGNSLNPKYLRGMEVVIHEVNGLVAVDLC